MATNRFICEVCNKGFQREQNLQLHRRGHNLPWKLKQKSTKEQKRKVYLCPEPTCVHHDPSRALGDLTGIKKHYYRKHGEKKWKCEKCSKKYAVQSDWKAHSKTCGTREYRCDCGTLFSRRDSFITHRAFCDALAQESARFPGGLNPLGTHLFGTNHTTSLSLSQVGNQLSQVQKQNQTATNYNSILRLGNNNVGAAATKFEHLIPPLNHSSFGHSPQSMPSSAFFMNDNTNQALFEEHQSQLQGLMQLQDLQGNTNNSDSSSVGPPNSNLFNLSFFPISSNIGTGTIIPGQFNNISGSNQGTTTTTTTTLYGNSIENESSPHAGSSFSSIFGNSIENASSSHMSATALLQQAAQMGSTTTTTTNNGSSLLGGMCTNNSSKAENDHHHNLQGLMNSIANGNTSLFGSMQGNENNLCGFHNVDESNNNKLPQNLSVNFGGSDKLTLDFLGVGGMMTNMSGGFSQREQQQHVTGTMSSLDHDLKSAQSYRHFGKSTLQ
ncbi:Zinc finger protein MAGPIE [Glycine soja]|nr:Zinc finger protein MAGPIE [Glycine soja]